MLLLQLDLVHMPYVGITNNVSESYNRVLKDFQNWKERPLDTVVEGFIHLQQYHVKEVTRGLAGTGQYVLKPGFPTVGVVPVMNNFSVEPESIVSTLQAPSSDLNLPQPANNDDCLSDGAHAKLLSGRVHLTDGVWIVDDNIRMQTRAGGRMIACDRCLLWFHQRCISGPSFTAGRRWYCEQCLSQV